MHLLISAAIGATSGLLVGLVTKTDGWLSFLCEAGAGAAGAALVGWFIEPLGQGESPNIAEIIGALFGAAFLLAVFELVAPIRKRKPSSR